MTATMGRAERPALRLSRRLTFLREYFTVNVYSIVERSK
jgi:hypothetical protein